MFGRGGERGVRGNGMGKDNKEIGMMSDWECIVLCTIGGVRRAHTLPREQPKRVCGSEVQYAAIRCNMLL